MSLLDLLLWGPLKIAISATLTRPPLLMPHQQVVLVHESLQEGFVIIYKLLPETWVSGPKT
eukprot:1156365-Pelagomonas_calceolata.AAC.4